MPESGPPVILVLGARGQVGWEVTRSLAPLGEIHALDRSTLDLANLDSVHEAVNNLGASIIVNAAAYTQVDKAEAEPNLAHRINAGLPALLAEIARRSNALLVHFSTDYVFDGRLARPYTEDDVPRPQTVYGTTKLAGDEAVLGGGAQAYVFRVGWVYGRRGRNFLRTIQRMAIERDHLRVVADQYGSPTWSRMIAEVTTLAVRQWLESRRRGDSPPASGLYNIASPDYTTWCGFAEAIVAAMRHAETTRAVVEAITTSEYPTPAARPAWSVLDGRHLRDAFHIQIPRWQEQLRLCLDD